MVKVRILRKSLSLFLLTHNVRCVPGTRFFTVFFAYSGDQDQGKVSFTYKKGEKVDLDVIKEGEEWKVDMR